MDKAEQETMETIAERAFGRVIKQNHAFGDIGMHLKQVQRRFMSIIPVLFKIKTNNINHYF